MLIYSQQVGVGSGLQSALEGDHGADQSRAAVEACLWTRTTVRCH
jgi:hypothetical protein